MTSRSSTTTTHASAQLTLAFEPTLPERFASLRDFLAHRVQVQPKPAKTIAMDMDMSPSLLSRKLSPSDGDTQRFNVDDLELFIQKTGDTSVIEYLASKYLHSDDHRAARLVAKVEALSIEMARALDALKGMA